MRVGLKPYSQAELPEKESRKPRLNGALLGNAALALEQNGACARSSPGPCRSRMDGPVFLQLQSRHRRVLPGSLALFFLRGHVFSEMELTLVFVKLRGLTIGEALLFTYEAPRWSRTREIGLSPTAGGGRGPAALSAAHCPTQTR